jgi:hypothetical protein
MACIMHDLHRALFLDKPEGGWRYGGIAVPYHAMPMCLGLPSIVSNAGTAARDVTKLSEHCFFFHV